MEQAGGPSIPDSGARRFAHLRIAAAALSVITVALVSAWLPGRADIPPLIESDYCYLLTAADRWYEGFGPTAPYPVAPFQPWEWKTDWAFLTQWPVGYPALICTVRWLLDADTLSAIRWINVFASALALVGWFRFVRRAMPPGIVGNLAACVAATSALTVNQLINPSTDLLMVAAIPWIMLLAWPSRSAYSDCEIVLATVTPTKAGAGRSWIRLGIAGFLAGLLFWIRYASVFVPAGMGLYLTIRAAGRRRRREIGEACVFFAGALVPMTAMLAVNHSHGLGESTQSQLNLGHQIHPNWSPHLIWTVWSRFTDLGYYDHHAWVRWMLLLIPGAMATACFWSRKLRERVRSMVSEPPVAAGVCLLVSFFVMIVTATVVFAGKFNFAALDRYYLPVRPLYFVLFIAPIAHLSRGRGRAVIGAALILAAGWIVQVEWVRDYQRATRAGSEATPYGARAEAFSPNATALYEWLSMRRANELILVSNFHEYIALETSIPALPIPPDRATLERWIARIRGARKIDNVNVLFVLDPDNRWRNYWLPPMNEVIERFGLTQRESTARPETTVYVYEPDAGS